MPPKAVTSEALGPTLGMYSHGIRRYRFGKESAP
jgi:hypothetical protein